MCDPNYFRLGTNELVIGIHGGTNKIKPTGLEFAGLVSYDISAVSGLPDLNKSHDRLFCSPIEPNPARADARVMVYVPRLLTVSMQIFDIQGRLVRDLGQHPMEEGYHAISLTDPDGSVRLSQGIYHVKIEAGGHTETRKLVIVH